MSFNYGVEWVMSNGERRFTVAYGDKDLDAVLGKLVAAGLAGRSKRVTQADPLRIGQYVVWEM
jgi:hypothetical protein